ncbi:MAG TPA: DNA polymerase III subunit gamma/tau [Candidatus Dormibacteraeota bacterium]|nr:DNA polymerase III subunit gamma/tau [Candidatus Dormibacteraeota bacterium]
MSYQTLYRKYRSQTFADLVGQEAVTRALQGAIASGRVAHAYLFSGSRGTGKTSSARLLAKALNCQNRTEGSAEPCGECIPCQAIAAGNALDVIEIDAASNRGIDDIRDLREKVRLAPSQGRFKIYIIDEAHMLTAESFNALLKTLEEPPPHVVFVLCTTEAQKVPLTVLGRCQQFPFRRLSEDVIAARLGMIAEREGIAIDADALSLLARTSEGSMRDAIGYLDQLAPLTSGRIDLAEARSLLGLADPLAVATLFDAVLDGRAHDALHTLTGLYEGGADLRPLVRGLMERCRDLLVKAIDARSAPARARLSLALDSLLHLDGEVRRHAEPRFLVEATLVRLAVAGDQHAPPLATAPLPPAAARSAPPAPVPQASPTAVPVAAVAAPPLPSSAPVPASAPMAEAEAGPEPDLAAEPELASPIEPPAGTQQAWTRVLEELPVSARGILKQAEVDFEGDTVVAVYPYKGQYDVAVNKQAEVARLVTAHFSPSTRFEIRLLPLSDRGVPARPTALAPEEHPSVVEALNVLGARVIDIKEIHE